MTLTLTGCDLTLPDLMRAATGQGEVALDPAARVRMQEHRALIDRVIEQRLPVYGVTTGLGAKASEVLDAATLAAFSVQTLRGRAHAIGPPLSVEIIRATLIIRANTMLLGASGAQVAVAAHIVACLNAGLTPAVGSTGSTGAADLVLGATLGLALIGEGQMCDVNGTIGEGDSMMRAHGIAPLVLGPRDGLALANHAHVSDGAAVIASAAARVGYEASQSAAALSLAGFGANLGPFRADVLALRPLPGQTVAARGLTARLSQSPLWQHGAARRLQDPLSLRNVAQIHGGVAAALQGLDAVLAVQINASSDNPAVLLDENEVLSTGNYFTTELALALDNVLRAFAHLAVAQVARMSKLLNPVFSGLPAFLARENSGSNGFAPLMKTAEAVLAEMLHAATPAPVWPSVNANGVEDCLTNALLSAQSLARVAHFSTRLSAMEMMISAQALDLRELPVSGQGPFIAALHVWVRQHCAALTQDRPLGAEIEAMAAALASETLPAPDQSNAGNPR